MGDLLKNNKNLQDDAHETRFSNSDSENEVTRDEDKRESGLNVNIERYKDPEGLSVAKMSLGLWLVQNRKHFFYIFVTVLGIIGVLTWGQFLYVYGSYVIVGVKDDDQLTREIVSKTIVGHEFFVERSPKDLIFGNVQVVKNLNNKYDFIIMVTNPNENYSANILSHLSMADFDVDQESNYILPQEKKHFIILGKEMERFTSSIEFVVDKMSWSRIDKHKYPDWGQFEQNHLDLEVNNIVFTQSENTVLTEKIPLNNLDFTASNKSAYNYRGVNLNIVVYGINSKILILDKYTVNNFMSFEDRSVSITIPGDFPTVSEVVIVPEIDITRDDVYIEFDGGIGEVK